MIEDFFVGWKEYTLEMSAFLCGACHVGLFTQGWRYCGRFSVPWRSLYQFYKKKEIHCRIIKILRWKKYNKNNKCRPSESGFGLHFYIYFILSPNLWSAVNLTPCKVMPTPLSLIPCIAHGVFYSGSKMRSLDVLVIFVPSKSFILFFAEYHQLSPELPFDFPNAKQCRKLHILVLQDVAFRLA